MSVVRDSRGRPQGSPLRIIASCVLCALCALCAPLRAQGPFIPLDSRADRAVRWAVDTGALPSLDPLTRPWRLAAARDALTQADTSSSGAAERAAVRWAAEAVAALADSVQAIVEAGVSAYRDGGSEPIRFAGASGVSTALGVRLQAGTGPWVVVVNPAFDERWRDDPTFTGYRGGPVTGRMVEAYLAVSGRTGELAFGRMARNWGPASIDGFQLSSLAAPGDQLAGTLRFGRFAITSVAQRLDDRDTLASVRYHRFFVAHRLTMRLGAGSWVALTETGVYGGYGSGFDLAMHAPLNLALLSQYNEGQNLNTLLGAEAAIRLPSRMRLELSGFLDDIQVDDSVLTDSRPTSYGLSAGLIVPLAELPLHLDLRYARVSSLAYRNSFDTQLVYSVRDIGIGRNASDFDEARLRLSWKASPPTDVFAEAVYLRQGSYDFRQPFPSDSVLALPGKGFLVAPVAHAVMARVSGVSEWSNGLSVAGSLGVLRTLAGATRPVATLTVRMRFDARRMRTGGAFPALAP